MSFEVLTLAILSSKTRCTFNCRSKSSGSTECPCRTGLPVVSSSIGTEETFRTQSLGRARVSSHSETGDTVVAFRTHIARGSTVKVHIVASRAVLGLSTTFRAMLGRRADDLSVYTGAAGAVVTCTARPTVVSQTQAIAVLAWHTGLALGGRGESRRVGECPIGAPSGSG